MRLVLLITTLFLFLQAASKTDSLKNKAPFLFGIEYKISTGIYYGHHLGLCINKNKHNFGAGAIFLPPENADPFKKHWDLGAYFNYDFYPFGTKRTINLLLHTSLNYINTTPETSTQSVFLIHFIGLGLKTKMIKNFSFKTDLGIYTSFYEKTKYKPPYERYNSS